MFLGELMTQCMNYLRTFFRITSYLFSRILGKTSVFWKLAKLPRGRCSILDNDCEIVCYGQLIDGTRLERPVFREGYVTSEPCATAFVQFRKIMKNVRLMGLNLCPVSEDGYVAREALSHMRFIPSYLVSPERLRNSVSGNPVSMEGKYFSLVNHWQQTPNYYHWLMNVLPRLALYQDPEGDRKILINEGLIGYQIETLKHLGVWEKCVVAPSNHLIVEDYMFAPYTSMVNGLNPQAIHFLRDGFLTDEQKQAKGDRKIYLSRKNASRSAVNEEEVTELFRESGWDIIDGAQHTLLEQVEIFSKASHICGVHGAGLLNLIWASKETHVIELFPSTRMVASNENIAAYLGMDYEPIAVNTGWNYKMEIPIDCIERVIDEAKNRSPQ